MPWLLRIFEETWRVPAQLKLRACIRDPLCDECEPETLHPDSGECSPDIVPTPIDPDDDDCVYDSECIPAWYLSDLYARMVGDDCSSMDTAIIGQLNVETGEFESFDPGHPITCEQLEDIGFVGPCCIRDCLNSVLDKRENDCLTRADIGDCLTADPDLFDGMTEEQRTRCCRYFDRLFDNWALNGESIVAEHCASQTFAGFDLPLRPTMLNVSYQRISLPAGSQKISERCYDIEMGGDCTPCLIPPV